MFMILPVCPIENLVYERACSLLAAKHLMETGSNGRFKLHS